MITNELILEILKKKLDGKTAKPSKYQGKRQVFIRERVFYDDKRYRLIFWFKDGTTNHLWVRNCYPID